MTLCRSCEHTRDRHLVGFGACDQSCLDPDMGDIYTCPCRHYESGGDE